MLWRWKKNLVCSQGNDHSEGRREYEWKERREGIRERVGERMGERERERQRERERERGGRGREEKEREE